MVRALPGLWAKGGSKGQSPTNFN